MLKRTSICRQNVLLVSLATVTLFYGCALEPEGLQGDMRGMELELPPDGVEILECTGLAPLCVWGCGGEMAGEPSCANGRWSCDEGMDVNVCPTYKGNCTSDEPCGAGYTCVKGIHHPVPSESGVCQRGHVVRDTRVENCDEWGTLMPAESSVLFPSMVGSIVKFAATVGVTFNCSQDGCIGAGECCGTCVGEYAAELSSPKSDAAPLLVRIESESIPCQGGPCDLSCSPMIVGETYRMWGLLTECTGKQSCRFVLMGSCLL